jgi:hypothetical protein
VKKFDSMHYYIVALLLFIKAIYELWIGRTMVSMRSPAPISSGDEFLGFYAIIVIEILVGCVLLLLGVKRRKS